MERNMALIGFAQLDTKQKKFFFDPTSAQGDWGWSSGQAMGISISCAGVLPMVQHTRARKHQHKQDFFFDVSLANH
jgi:hypothetical protein